MEIREIKVSENIKRLRKEHGYRSAKELAITLRQVGYYCSGSTIKSWESGHRNPTIEAVAALCAIFDVSADILLF